MISVSEALAIVIRESGPLDPVCFPLMNLKPGMVLSQPVYGTEDLPPFDKSMMDGYAFRCSDLDNGRTSFAVLEEITAGKVPVHPVTAGNVSRIMTGAPMPSGADAVVPVEMTTTEEEKVIIQCPPPKKGWNILPKGGEISAGELLINKGAILRAAELAILASIGCKEVNIIPKPDIAVLCTGDELVEADQSLQPGQIRNSNGPLLVALAGQTGMNTVNYLGIAPDTVDELTSLIEKGLQSTVLLLSGGVSAGKLDLVPSVLQKLGVKSHFHKVSMKPGKPLFFGTLDHSSPSGRKSLVFGLPGNPVSAMVCFELFVKPAMMRLAGFPVASDQDIQARITHDYISRGDRPTYHPARLLSQADGWAVQLVHWNGSSDMKGVIKANAFAVLSSGNHQFKKGDMLTVKSMDRDLYSYLAN